MRKLSKRKMNYAKHTSKEPICSMGGTLQEHNISSRFGCIYRCHRALDNVNMIDHSKEKCDWSKSLKEPEVIRKEWNA